MTKFDILYKNWFIHNVFAHPLMQILNMIGLDVMASYIHDSTLPKVKHE